MELKIHAIHFDTTEKLNAFISKKAQKLEKTCDAIIKAEFVLKVVKPETAKNKETALNVSLPTPTSTPKRYATPSKKA